MKDVTRMRIKFHRLSFRWKCRGKILKVKGKILQFLVNRDREKGYRYSQHHDALLKCVKEYNSEMLSYPLEGFDVKKYERTLREEGREEGRKEIAMEKLIQVLNSLMYSKETAICQLVKHYELSEEEAATKVEMYWQS